MTPAGMVAPADRVGECPHESHDVAPEVHTNRDERAKVERNVERLIEPVVLLEIRPVRGPRDKDEMPRGGDRKELGQALYETEGERLTVRERVGVVPHSQDRQCGRGRERRPRDAEDDGAAHGGILARPSAGGLGRNRAQIAAIR
jgi:hypothetical protein